MPKSSAPISYEPKQQTKAKLDKAGRVVIPAAFRKALGVKPGEYLILRIEDGELRAWTFEHAVRKSQEIIHKYIPPGRSLVDELIAERRSEAVLEQLDFDEARRRRAERDRE
ncbi:MAG: AbrB/MazE/SpoVT family DNA-binding domain-containing protein [Chloroflexi bacterium]|nr:AbrB/MazE/SpoVT family DNA-binding domain-containing protein [Chloroflexota bacterium]